MSGLREAAVRIAGMGRFPTPNTERKLACERALSRLDDLSEGRKVEPEPWDHFLCRIGVVDG